MPWTTAVPIINGTVVGRIFLSVSLLFYCYFYFLPFRRLNMVCISFSHFHSNLHINCKDSVWLLRLSSIAYTIECQSLMETPFLSLIRRFAVSCFSLLWLLNNLFLCVCVCVFFVFDFSSCAIVCIHFSHCYQSQHSLVCLHASIQGLCIFHVLCFLFLYSESS